MTKMENTYLEIIKIY